MTAVAAGHSTSAGGEEAARAGLAQRAALGAVHAYQHLRAGSVSPCRFYPSCSAYAEEAVERHGAWRGSLLALRRLGRCRPFGGHGVDLVPDSIEGRRQRRARRAAAGVAAPGRGAGDDLKGRPR